MGGGGDVVRNDDGCDIHVRGGAESTLADNAADDNVFRRNNENDGGGATTRGRRCRRRRPTSMEEDCAVVSRPLGVYIVIMNLFFLVLTTQPHHTSYKLIVASFVAERATP